MREGAPRPNGHEVVRDAPDDLRALLADATLTPVATGLSSASVHRVDRPDGTAAYLKVERHDAPGEGIRLLADEHARLTWLAGRLPVPEVHYWYDGREHDPPAAYLLTDALPGTPAHQLEHLGDVQEVIAALATGLRAVHDLDVTGCPFPISLDDRIALATERVREGLVDRAYFEPAYARYEPEELLASLIAAAPAEPDAHDRVFVHGDYCLPNVMIDEGRVAGYLDLGRAGVADRHLDLAIASRSLVLNIGREALGPFFDAYGLDFPTLARIDFYVMLDEFF